MAKILVRTLSGDEITVVPGRRLHDVLTRELGRIEAARLWGEAVDLLRLVNPDGLTASQVVAQDLKGHKEAIYSAAGEGRREFFIELGKLLEGKRRKLNTWSKLDMYVALILCLNPAIKSTEAVEVLNELGYRMSPLAFKQKKYNWKRAAMETRKRWEKIYGWIYRGNSFLDNAGA